MPAYKTDAGRRPDLEAIEVNAPESYIGDKIYPVVSTLEKTGTIYYKTVTADSAAQTGRSSGTAPTRTLLTDSSTTFSCAEAIKRYGVDKDEVKQMGGIESADKLGGMASKRSVMRKLEGDIATQLYTGTATNISSDILGGIQTAAQSVKRYAGKTGFVCAASVYNWIIAQTAVTGKMAWSFPIQGLETSDVLSVKTAVFKALLQTVYGIDVVLVGDDDHWQPTGKADYAAVVKLPDASEFSHKMDPVLGKTMLYMPDGQQPFEIESFYNDIDRINTYDASMWYNIKEFNSSAKYLCKGLYSST